MYKPRPVIEPVEPGTLLRVSPEKHPDGKFVMWTTLFGKESCYEGNPIFEVKSYILDREGGHVTFERYAGTFYVLGGGSIVDMKFPYPHPMFEVVGDAEAEQLRLRWQAEDLIELARSRRGRWLNWLLPRALTFGPNTEKREDPTGLAAVMPLHH